MMTFATLLRIGLGTLIPEWSRFILTQLVTFGHIESSR